MKKLQSLTLDQILKTYALPHRLLAYFASQCAKDAVSKLKDPDPRSLAAISMAEAFGNGEDFTPEHMKEVIDKASDAAAYAAYAANAASDAAHAATSAASYAASYAAHAATYAAAYAASYAANAANSAAYAAIYDKALNSYKTLLLTLIETRLTKLEQILIIGEEI